MGQGQLISTEEHGLKVLKVYNENGRAVAFDVELSGDDVIVALNDMRTYQTLDIKSVNIPWWKSTSQTTLRVPVGFTPEQVTFELFPFGLDLNAIATKTAGFSLAESKPIKVESAIGEDSNLIAEDKPLISMPAIASFGGGLTSSIKWLAVGAAAIGLLVYSPIIKNVASAALQAPKRQNPSSAKRNTKKAVKARSQQRMSNGRFK